MEDILSIGKYFELESLEKKLFFKLFRIKLLVNFILNPNSKLIRYHLLRKPLRQCNHD